MILDDLFLLLTWVALVLLALLVCGGIAAGFEMMRRYWED